MEKINAIDLRIVEHLDVQKLPESLHQMLSLASTPEEQDIILMATLAAASAGIPVSNEASTMYGRFLCSDADYYTAEIIGNRLLLHMAAAYKMIEGEKTELVPQIETSCQKQMLYERLGGEYNHKALAQEAKRQGISKRTAERWNLSWIENGLVTKINYAEYKKRG